jgi:hypothetical protein
MVSSTGSSRSSAVYLRVQPPASHTLALLPTPPPLSLSLSLCRRWPEARLSTSCARRPPSRFSFSTRRAALRLHLILQLQGRTPPALHATFPPLFCPPPLQLTGNPIYREWGWRMFEALEKWCRTQWGYGAYPDVRYPGRAPDDRMERCVRELVSRTRVRLHDDPSTSMFPCLLRSRPLLQLLSS